MWQQGLPFHYSSVRGVNTGLELLFLSSDERQSTQELKNEVDFDVDVVLASSTVLAPTMKLWSFITSIFPHWLLPLLLPLCGELDTTEMQEKQQNCNWVC